MGGMTRWLGPVDRPERPDNGYDLSYTVFALYPESVLFSQPRYAPYCSGGREAIINLLLR